MTMLKIGPERREGCSLDCGISQELVRHICCMIRALRAFKPAITWKESRRIDVPSTQDSSLHSSVPGIAVLCMAVTKNMERGGR